MKRYTGKSSAKVTEATISTLERIITFTGQGQHGRSQKIVLETVIYTRVTKRVIDGDLDWREVEGGMNSVGCKTIKGAREVIKRIKSVDPLHEFNEGLIRSGIQVSASRRLSKKHAGFDEKAEEYWED